MTCIGYVNLGGVLYKQPTRWFFTESGKSRTAILTSTPTLMLSNDIIEVNSLPATSSLTLLNVTSNLDGATMDCYFPNIGGASGTVAGVFTLKIYRKCSNSLGWVIQLPACIIICSKFTCVVGMVYAARCTSTIAC